MAGNLIMYYHIQIITDKNEEICRFDIRDLSVIENEILVPHLSGRDYYLNGFSISPSKVKRISVTESTRDSEECVSLSYSEMKFSDTEEILPQECMFDNEEFSRNITDELLEKVDSNLVEGITKTVPSALELDSKIKSCLQQLTELENSFSDLKNISKNMLDEKAARKYRIHNYMLVSLIILYYTVIVGCIVKFGWEDMEPVTYVLSIS
ncbi:MAG TPA: hypothetical protein VK400_16365, partial [Pyrinomonadaceae bacterium]|nr:hypothetical protein [Pyrinomonadaceae bacterium]